MSIKAISRDRLNGYPVGWEWDSSYTNVDDAIIRGHQLDKVMKTHDVMIVIYSGSSYTVYKKNK
jgi:hypothetical protein